MQPKKKQGRIIGVLRSPTNLYQLIFQEPIGGKAQPLLTKALSPHEAPQLYAAWERLSCADLEDPELPQALLLVLESTLPMRGFDWRRQLPAETKTKEPPRPTAANPRAYRGTKRQPPKETEAERLDLRAYLGAWRVEQQWLSKLGLPSVDPYFKKNFSQHDANRDIYSEEFISCFLPCLQAAGAFYLVGFLWSSVISLKTLFGESWDDALPGLLLLLLGEGVAAFDNFFWVGLLPSFGARCHEALREIIRTQAYRASPFWVKPEEIFRFLSSTPERHFAVRLEALLRGVINKAHFAYLESGFLIADHFNEAFKFEEIPAGREAVSLSISRLLSGAEKDFSADGGAGFWALYIWRCCGQLVGLQERLQQLLSSSVRGRPLYLAVRFLCSFSPAQEWEERWRFLYQNIPQMIALLESIEPTYQEKFLLDVNSWFWGLAEEDLPLWSSGLSLLAQRACPPFSTGSHGAYVMLGLCLFIYAKEKSLRRAELIPPKHWKTLEKSCLDNNASTLIDLGLRALCFTDLEFSLRALQTCPGALLEASRWLGMVTKEQRDQALVDTRWPFDAKEKTLHELVEFIDKQDLFGLGLVPRVVREFLQGKANLTKQQQQRAHQKLSSRLELLRCHCVRHNVEQLLRAIFPEFDGTPQQLHALSMLTYAEQNRRGLRRLLNQRFSGALEAERHHALSRQWLSKHPTLKEQLWLSGVSLERETSLGKISITLERDLLEVLKMGTYTKTCLGLGGDFMSSAAAVAMDINKQVLFARDERGAVLARQLIAYTEAEHLLMYYVYPLSLKAELKCLFLEYNTIFAKALGVPLCIDSHPNEHRCEDQVPTLLSHYFFDDGAWDGVS